MRCSAASSQHDIGTTTRTTRTHGGDGVLVFANDWHSSTVWLQGNVVEGFRRARRRGVNSQRSLSKEVLRADQRAVITGQAVTHLYNIERLVIKKLILPQLRGAFAASPEPLEIVLHEGLEHNGPECNPDLASESVDHGKRVPNVKRRQLALKAERCGVRGSNLI